MKYSLIAATVVVLGCSRDVVQPPNDPLISCVLSGPTVTPATVTLVPGDTVRLHYAGIRGSCTANPKPDTIASWSSSDTLVAVVGPASGTVRAIGRGVATIVATSTADPAVKGAAVVSVVNTTAAAVGKNP